MYVGDSSRPDAARVRDLREEALRVYRVAGRQSQVARQHPPSWLQGRAGAAATVDYIFGFDATAHVAPDLVYEGLAAEYALSPEMQRFLEQSNPWALHAIADRLLEAADRGLWEKPAPETVDGAARRSVEGRKFVEARGERVRVRS